MFLSNQTYTCTCICAASLSAGEVITNTTCMSDKPQITAWAVAYVTVSNCSKVLLYCDLKDRLS